MEKLLSHQAHKGFGSITGLFWTKRRVQLEGDIMREKIDFSTFKNDRPLQIRLPFVLKTKLFDKVQAKGLVSVSSVITR